MVNATMSRAGLLVVRRIAIVGRGSWVEQSGEECRRGILPSRQVRSQAAHGSQNNDLRRYFGIASCDPRSPGNTSPGC